jgi:hypothetical protein
MNRTKIFYPLIILLTGMMGLFLSATIVESGPGLIPRGTGTKLESGETIITESQTLDCLKRYVRSQSKLWALDILSVYVFCHGVLGTVLNARRIRVAFCRAGGKKSFFLHLMAGIPVGVLFWITMYHLISKAGMLSHYP